MIKILGYTFLGFLLFGSSAWAQGFGGGGFSKSGVADRLLEVTVANLGTPTSGTVRIVTDGASASDCTTGSGSNRVLCAYDGTTWAALGGAASTPTLDQAFDQGKVIDGANSLANAFRVGSGAAAATDICIYTDATLGAYVTTCGAANVRQRIQTNQTGGWYDVEGASDILAIDPDAASVNAMYTFSSGYRPLKSIWFGASSLSTDGTQCAAPAEVTINSGPKLWTIICTENNAGRMQGSIVMPDSWDAGTITLTPYYIQTAADTGSVALEGAAMCRGMTETINSTWSAEVEIDDAAITGSNAMDSTVSSAITPNGTCAAGDFLHFYVDIDATDNPTTAAATLHFVGVKLEYSTSSLSD